jgi:hypothetical protein
MKITVATIGAMLLSATLWTPTAGAQCPDTCVNGVCSNNAAVSCTSDAKCVGAAVNAACPCDASTNHGLHQKCVVQTRNQIRKQGCSTAGIASCSARSTCGKPNRVLCCSVAATGTCTGATSTTAGTCTNTNNGVAISCMTNADCTVTSGPQIARNATSCTGGGGYVSGTGSICSACTPPVACCVPSSTTGQPGTCEILTAADCGAAIGTYDATAAATCDGVTCQ